MHVPGKLRLAERLGFRLCPATAPLFTRNRSKTCQGKPCCVQAQEAKVALEQRMLARVADSKKQSGGRAFIQANWFNRVPGAEAIKPGEGIRWRYGGKYWASRMLGFKGRDFPDIF